MSSSAPPSDEARPVRLHISPLPQPLATDSSDLVSRLSLFGAPLSGFSIHKKPSLDTSFAFITLSLTKQQYNALRKSLNGVKFKGAVINIEEAKAPDFPIRAEAMILQNEDERTFGNEAQLYKRRALALREQRLLQRRLYHVRKGHYQFGKCERGRLRATERDIRQSPSTFRIRIGNKAKIVKCKKQKLWGKARGGDVNDLIWKFVDDEGGKRGEVAIGRWVNGKGDEIEIVKKERVSTGDFPTSKVAELEDELTGSTMEDAEIEVVPSNSVPVKEESAEERIHRLENEKNLRILQDMFGEDRQETDVVASTTNPTRSNDDATDDDDAIFDIISSGMQIQAPDLNDGPAINYDFADQSIINVADSVTNGLYDDIEPSTTAAATTDGKDTQDMSAVTGVQNDEGPNSRDFSASPSSSESDQEEYNDNNTNEAYDSDSSNSDDETPSSGDSETDSSSSSSESDSEHEFMGDETEPAQTVASSKEPEKKLPPDLTGGPMKNVVTERLRSLFNPDESGDLFSLVQNSDVSDYDSDVDHLDKQEEEEEEEGGGGEEEETEREGDNDAEQTKRSSSPFIEPNVVEDDDEEGAAPLARPRSQKVKYSKPTTRSLENIPLLFPHPDSAFLNAQTQFSRASTRPALSRIEWEKEFFEKRGEWMRKAKRRRRDVVRMFRRKEGDNPVRRRGGNKQSVDSVDGNL
ncbi:hypothetical protein V1515DRAFT_638318 [Lipomyces mesembrius]